MGLASVVLILALGFIVMAMATGAVIRGVALSADPNDLRLWYDSQDEDDDVHPGVDVSGLPYRKSELPEAKS
jgi:hypothetical protein